MVTIGRSTFGFWNRRLRVPSALLVVLRCLLCACGAATVSLEPLADAEIREQAPSLVVAGGTMVAGGLGDLVGNEARRALLRFDVTAVPAEAIIRQVGLRLEVVRVPQNAGNSVFELRRLLLPWDEGAVTWVTRRIGFNWQQPGALGDTDVVTEASSAASAPDLGAATFASTPRLVADVQAWVRTPASNHGWLLRAQSESTLRTARHFATREAVAADSRPRLTITYTLPPRIEDVRLEGAEFVGSFVARPGETYRLHQRASLSGDQWQAIRSFGPFPEDTRVPLRAPVVGSQAGQFFQLTVD